MSSTERGRDTELMLVHTPTYLARGETGGKGLSAYSSSICHTPWLYSTLTVARKQHPSSSHRTSAPSCFSLIPTHNTMRLPAAATHLCVRAGSSSSSKAKGQRARKREPMKGQNTTWTYRVGEQFPAWLLGPNQAHAFRCSLTWDFDTQRERAPGEKPEQCLHTTAWGLERNVIKCIPAPKPAWPPILTEQAVRPRPRAKRQTLIHHARVPLRLSVAVFYEGEGVAVRGVFTSAKRRRRFFEIAKEGNVFSHGGWCSPRDAGQPSGGPWQCTRGGFFGVTDASTTPIQHAYRVRERLRFAREVFTSETLRERVHIA